MAHELEIRADGTAAFVAGKGTNAWHGLGVELESEHMTRQEVFAQLDEFRTPIELHRLMVRLESGLIVPTDGYATVRRDDLSPERRDENGEFLPPKVLGHGLSEQYKMIEAALAFEFTDEIVESGEARWVTAGLMKEGRQMFGVLEIPREVKVAGHVDENHSVYILTTNSWDASLSLGWHTTMVRGVCANTVKIGIAGAYGSYTIRHTGDTDAKVAQAREALGITFAYVDAFEQEMNKLVDVKISDSEFDAFLESLVPVKSKNGVSERNVRSIIRDVYFKEDDLQDIRGTRYGALQAVAEYVDHRSAVRNVDDPEARFRRSFVDAHKTLTPQAHKLLAVN